MTIPLTAKMPVPFYPPALLKRNQELHQEGKEQIHLMIRVPTPYERDAFSASLVRGGVVHYSRTQIRDLMLAGVAFLYPPEDFERIHGELEGLWQAKDAIDKVQIERTARMLELLEQQQALPPEKHLTQEAMEKELLALQPEVMIDEPTRVRVTAIQQDIASRYEPLQKAFADLAEQDIRRNWLCVEIYVINWKGLEHAPDGNGHGGITRPEAEYLRKHIGAEAFDQIGDFVMGLQSIDGDEEKNLASLIESSSAPIGSTLAESMASTEPGSSTDEPSIAIPDTGLPEMIASSSSSTKASKTTTAASPSSPTAKPSSTSRRSSSARSGRSAVTPRKPRSSKAKG